MAESAKELAQRYRREAALIASVADVLDPPRRRRKTTPLRRELEAISRTSGPLSAAETRTPLTN
jgi:hypothetical protein